MEQLVYTNGRYLSPLPSISWFGSHFPSLAFYASFIGCVLEGVSQAKRGLYDGEAWALNSLHVLQALERVGVRIDVKGLEHVEQLEGACVFIGNHMSMMETMILPAMIQPITPVTFVIKQSLLEYPAFKHVMRTRKPIAVTRTNPRLDLKIVMEEGTHKLQSGTSIIIFPQTTRMVNFEQEHFNSIGVKLAKKAGVPIIPVALVTDAWQNGKFLKDFGKIDPSKLVSFSFGKPLQVEGRGSEEHAQIVEFIQSHLQHVHALES
ncbi:1-acyl-sn-glycerol-3-phosphate acyltransferase [candidate division KSB3 bacterium]|uniref:1-acyl-sn-glycerol-3-phosphate acyltransferase n=1 Tax=candidate division KSB3 bacterium TaxID=2044937 RepID=A0A2G6K9G4_9BACT|nr:MAG: 1-acyl-sn-glycerol-3-phosphate acyltransferase [candidate division KSB3 bacterium]